MFRVYDVLVKQLDKVANASSTEVRGAVVPPPTIHEGAAESAQTLHRTPVRLPRIQITQPLHPARRSCSRAEPSVERRLKLTHCQCDLGPWKESQYIKGAGKGVEAGNWFAAYDVYEYQKKEVPVEMERDQPATTTRSKPYERPAVNGS